MSETQGPMDSAGERLTAMDAARGLGLLGIFLVNMGSFAQPSDEGVLPPDDGSLANQIAYWFVEIFCTGKFYPLFALLFGMGIVMQMQRIAGRGRKHVPLMLRRMGLLALIGFLHVVLLWSGDILFMYALFGLLVIAMWRISVQWLLILGIGAMAIVALSTLVMGVFFWAFMLLIDITPNGAWPPDDRPPMHQLPEDDEDDAVEDDDERIEAEAVDPISRPANGRLPVIRLFTEGYDDSSVDWHERWQQFEIEALRDRDFVSAMTWRLFAWIIFVFASMISIGWYVLGMMLVGAALAKVGFLDSKWRNWHVRLVMAGAFLGLPLATVGAVSPFFVPEMLAMFVAMFFQMIGGPLMSLAYFSIIALAAQATMTGRLLQPLAAAGRMALTNYLMQSLVATFVMYHWGLRQFGMWSEVPQVAFALAVFACQMLLSVAWLSFFRLGPMEWLWRAGTYGSLPPLRKRSVG